MQRILRLPDVRNATGYSTSSIYAHIKLGTFPTPIRLGPRAVGWLEETIQAWLETRILASGKRLVEEPQGGR
jgi:prophage regulatory protein